MSARVHVTVELDMHRTLSALTLQIVTRGVFGTELPDDVHLDRVYNSLDLTLKAAVGMITSGLFMIPGYRSLPTPSNRKAQAGIDELNTMLTRVIQSRRAVLEAQTGTADAESEETSDLLALLLRARDDDDGKMDDEELRVRASLVPVWRFFSRRSMVPRAPP